MHKPTITTLVLSCLFSGAAYCADIDGFRDMRFGDPPEKLGSDAKAKPSAPGLTDPNERCFSRPSDKLALASTPVQSIEYCFYKGRLFNVVITGVSGANSERQFTSALNAAFGEPKSAMGMTFWGDYFATTGGSILMLTGGKYPLAFLASNDIRQQRKRDEQEASKQKL